MDVPCDLGILRSRDQVAMATYMSFISIVRLKHWGLFAIAKSLIASCFDELDQMRTIR